MTKLYYAGIGSRRTPDHILSIMDHVARHLFFHGWTLRSGGAGGADSAFESAVDHEAKLSEQDPRKEIYLPWKGFNHNKSMLHPLNYPFTAQEKALAADHHPAWHKVKPSAQLLHMRNVRQLIGVEAIHGEHVKPSSFVVCWTFLGQAVGGTGQTLRMAHAARIPIINLGEAKTPTELERLLLKIDLIQQKAKLEAAEKTVPEGATVQ